MNYRLVSFFTKFFIIVLFVLDFFVPLGVIHAADNQESYDKSYGAFGAIIPKCALASNALTPDCMDMTVFMVLAVNIGKYLFGVVGALALGAFVYGGFLLILSEGKQEKVKKGADAMLAAVIGLLVAFGGYVLIRFLGLSFDISTNYLLK